MRLLVPVFLLTVELLAADPVIEGQTVHLRVDPEARTWHAAVEAVVSGPGWLEAPGWTPASIEVGEETTVALETVGTLDPGAVAVLARGWFLDADSPVTVTVETPDPWRAVADGRRISEDLAEGRWTVTYRLLCRGGRDPFAACPVLIAPWRTVAEQEFDGWTGRVYSLEESSVAATVLIRLGTMFERVAAWLPPPPSGRFDLVVGNGDSDPLGIDFRVLDDSEFQRMWGTAWPPEEPSPLWEEAASLLRGRTRGERESWLAAISDLAALYTPEVSAEAATAIRRRWIRELSLADHDAGPLGAWPSFRHVTMPPPRPRAPLLLSMLRDELGPDRFAGFVRTALSSEERPTLGWGDFIAALSNAAGRDLRPWFEPWTSTDSAGGYPSLRLGPLFVEGETITGTIVQTQPGPAFALRVPLHVTTGDGVEVHEIVVGSKERLFRITCSLPPHRVALDPDARLLRVIPRDQLAPCLRGVLTAAQRAGTGDVPESLGLETIEPSLPADKALFLGGLPDGLRETVLPLLRRQVPTLAIEADGFRIEGTRYAEPGDALLISAARPGAPGLPLTLLYGVGGMPRDLPLEEYALDGWVAFRGGKAVARGGYDDDRLTRVQVTRALERQPDALMRDLLLLTDPAQKGRRAGAMASYKLANTLRGVLFKAGTKPIPWPSVSIPTGELAEKCELVLLDGEQRTPVPNPFLPFHRTGTPDPTPVFERVVDDPAPGADLHGALALLPETATYERALECAEAGAVAVGVVASDDALTARAAECAWVGGLPLALAGRTPDEEATVSGLIARTSGPPLRVPWIYLTASAGETLRGHGAGGVIRFRVKRGDLSTSHMLGAIGDPRTPPILICAAWDGPGLIDGVPAEAASWNAAGVAAVLWVAEQLARDHEEGRLQQPVAIALVGGEHFGSLGSLQLAAGLRHPETPLAKPTCILRVAGVGSRGDGRVALVGRGLDGAPWGLLPEAFAQAKLSLQPVASETAAAHPLDVLGVPVVTLSAADPTVRGTPADSLALVDLAQVRSFARALYRGVARIAAP